MFGFGDNDGEELALRLLIGVLIGAFCGGVPLAVGLVRGHKQLAWTGFGVSILLGVGLGICAMIPAIIFTIIVAVTEPIERGRRKKKPPRRRRRDRADDFLDDADRYDDDRPRRRYEDDDDEDEDYRPPRRRARVEDDDDDYDPPRRRRRPRDDDD